MINKLNDLKFKTPDNLEEMMGLVEEQWPIPGYDQRYELHKTKYRPPEWPKIEHSDYLVWSIIAFQYIKIQFPVSVSQYPHVYLYSEKLRCKRLTMRYLVAIALLGEKPPGYWLTDKSNDRRNWNPENLWYAPSKKTQKTLHLAERSLIKHPKQGISGVYFATIRGMIYNEVDNVGKRKVAVSTRVKYSSSEKPYNVVIIDGVEMRQDYLIAEAYHGACPYIRPYLKHKNGNTLDDRPENLEWINPEYLFK